MKKIPEIVVVSGKGGTGKTSFTAAFAALSEQQIMLGDCDVDAANLHLLVNPKTHETEECRYGYEAHIDPERCVQCGLYPNKLKNWDLDEAKASGFKRSKERPYYNMASLSIVESRELSLSSKTDSSDCLGICQDVCRFDAIKNFSVNPVLCEGCGVCAWNCPVRAISLEERVSGEVFCSRSRYGQFVHGRLSPGAENSGKLVARIRERCRDLVQDERLILLDGPPGIGCPTIASLTGAQLAVIVTEPTPSGYADCLRIFQLVRHFALPCLVCVNKYDLNPDLTDEIYAYAQEQEIGYGGNIPYDPLFTRAQRLGCSVIECGSSPICDALANIWNTIKTRL